MIIVTDEIEIRCDECDQVLVPVKLVFLQTGKSAMVFDCSGCHQTQFIEMASLAEQLDGHAKLHADDSVSATDTALVSPYGVQ